jgi:hypothetical protein
VWLASGHPHQHRGGTVLVTFSVPLTSSLLGLPTCPPLSSLSLCFTKKGEVTRNECPRLTWCPPKQLSSWYRTLVSLSTDATPCTGHWTPSSLPFECEVLNTLLFSLAVTPPLCGFCVTCMNKYISSPILKSIRNTQCGSSHLQSQLLSRQRSGGSQFKVSPGREFLRLPHLHQ